MLQGNPKHPLLIVALGTLATILLIGFAVPILWWQFMKLLGFKIDRWILSHEPYVSLLPCVLGGVSFFAVFILRRCPALSSIDERVELVLSGLGSVLLGLAFGIWIERASRCIAAGLAIAAITVYVIGGILWVDQGTRGIYIGIGFALLGPALSRLWPSRGNPAGQSTQGP